MKNKKLYIIPSPIGNLNDVSVRIIETIKECNIILCEDTRETGKLLNNLELKKKKTSYHKYNEKEMSEKFNEIFEKNEIVGLMSDRGTPIISDPGNYVLQYAIENNIEVISIPGPCALIPAITVSGLNAEKFLFYGFLDSKEQSRKNELTALKDFKYTMIFYESPHRINKTLKNIQEIFGNREISISREISKMYEEHIRGEINNVIKENSEIRGEIVLVVAGNIEDKEKISNEEIKKYINFLIQDGIKTNDAIKEATKEFKLNKNEVYKIFHDLR